MSLYSRTVADILISYIKGSHVILCTDNLSNLSLLSVEHRKKSHTKSTISVPSKLLLSKGRQAKILTNFNSSFYQF